MRRTIRHIETQKYLTDNGDWTTDLRSARHFEDMSAMIRECQQRPLTGVEFVLMMGDQPNKQYDIVLPYQKPRSSP
jgi:hypothetical protein